MKREAVWAEWLYQDKHSSTHLIAFIECTFVSIGVALARVAALPGYSWAEHGRVSSHLLRQPHL